MKLLNCIMILTASLLFVSCGQKPNNNPVSISDNNYKVSGKIISDGKPVSGALIQIGDVFNWKTTTDNDGNFTVTNVTKGEYQFLIEKNLDNGKVVFYKSQIALQTDVTNVGEISLPESISLTDLDASQVSKNSIKLGWTKSTDKNFIEYKLFRKDDTLIDDSTGELIYETTNINDTSFYDLNFRTGKSIYYRLYVISADQKYAGSNILSTFVPEVNLLDNGGFELYNSNMDPNYWLQNIVGTPTFKYFTVSKDAKHSGDYGISIFYDDSQANPPQGQKGWGGLIQVVASGDLRKDRVYELSFWSKTINGSFQVRLIKNGNSDQPIISYVTSEGQDWNQKTFSFKPDSDGNYYEVWINTKKDLSSNNLVNAYIDDIKIIK